MHPSDREQLMDQLGGVELEIEQVEDDLRRTECNCGRGREECDRCHVAYTLERDLEDLQSQRHRIRQQFPEFKYANEP